MSLTFITSIADYLDVDRIEYNYSQCLYESGKTERIYDILKDPVDDSGLAAGDIEHAYDLNGGASRS